MAVRMVVMTADYLVVMMVVKMVSSLVAAKDETKDVWTVDYLVVKMAVMMVLSLD